jgi:hypothetical protein
MANKINISTSTNKVTITNNNPNSVNINNDGDNKVTVNKSSVETVNITSLGPQGPQGIPGSLNTSSSLNITGSITALGNISSSGLLVQASGASGGGNTDYDVKFETTTNHDLNVAFEAGSTNQSHFQIKVRDEVDRFDISSDTTNPIISLLDGGNVGIGTTTPTEKLEVVGNISASGNIYANDLILDYDSLPSSDPTNKGQIYRDGSRQLFISAG